MLLDDLHRETSVLLSYSKEGLCANIPCKGMMYVVTDLLLVNFIIFYWAAHLPLFAVIFAYLLEVLTIGAGIALWGHRHKLGW
jgi:hypothetical protein